MKIGDNLGILPSPEFNPELSEGVTGILERRSFLGGLGKATLGATTALLFGDALKAQSPAAATDSATQILTAALIAEDLATTFYYNGLVGSIITNANLAGPGGTALNVTAGGNAPNVAYLRAAMAQEVSHANLLRAVGSISVSAAADPYQTFYFPTGTFTNLTTFLNTLAALEQAFIGAYLNAVREFSLLASRATVRGVPTGSAGGPFSGAQLSYYAEVAASILGIECEHRVLGLIIANVLQPNDRLFEQTASLTSVYHGTSSAVAALTPFLTPSTGPAYSFATAIAAAGTLGLGSTSALSSPPAQ